MRLALFGGSFNPVHKGHIALADAVLSLTDYDHLMLIPAAVSPHKQTQGLVEASRRLEMVRLAIGDRQDMILSDCEIRREGPSYTFDTVRYIYDNYDIQGKPGLIIGDDWLEGFSRWYRADELANLVDLVIAGRDGAEPTDFPYPHRVLKNALVPVSSTQIREKAAAGEDITPFVPAPVADYISTHGLYTTD